MHSFQCLFYADWMLTIPRLNVQYVIQPLTNDRKVISYCVVEGVSANDYALTSNQVINIY